ncbi:hypothetical protein CONCODRAFT_78271 [Conidiobolus coronatus NRRL 28638]|uniref:Uncharacterized protein n=1 Tax=Conidiobolus coronatus (strain ATCC 28846 / CBS 209.66 / NRRL 28638) TaxID=796925 RepID=A0A137P9J5_CONC2|nr:hypothetical protein CONCODRAFT_78271 [Conidiobolus coronatus NRRL 28638]|eukprot:KXN71581.1 hypothetical protein CONCODRAFT_78271 [Conidiobolus coronatus NRRL 28638]
MEPDQLQILIICISVLVGFTVFAIGVWMSIRYYRKYYTIQGTIVLTQNDSTSHYKLNSLNDSMRSSYSDNSRQTTGRRSSIAMTNYSNNLDMSTIVIAEPVASHHSLQSKPSFPSLPSHIIKQPYQLSRPSQKSTHILPL